MAFPPRWKAELLLSRSPAECSRQREQTWAETGTGTAKARAGWRQANAQLRRWSEIMPRKVGLMYHSVRSSAHPEVLGSFPIELARFRHQLDSARSAGWIIIHQAGHVLGGLVYRYHVLDQCRFPGYERVHWQTLTKRSVDETHEWFQTVHVLA